MVHPAKVGPALLSSARMLATCLRVHECVHTNDLCYVRKRACSALVGGAARPEGHSSVDHCCQLQDEHEASELSLHQSQAHHINAEVGTTRPARPGGWPVAASSIQWDQVMRTAKANLCLHVVLSLLMCMVARAPKL